MEYQFLEMLFGKGLCHQITLQNAADFTPILESLRAYYLIKRHSYRKDTFSLHLI